MGWRAGGLGRPRPAARPGTPCGAAPTPRARRRGRSGAFGADDDQLLAVRARVQQALLDEPSPA